MAKFCNVCWSEMQDNEDTCRICGTRVATAAPAAQAAPVAQQAPAANYNAVPQQAAPAANYNAVPQQNVYNYAPPVNTQPQVAPAAVSVGSFFGLNLLFSLPIIGFIFTIVMSFAPQNKTIKNFARSYLIWHIIAAVCISFIFILFSLILNDLESGDLIEEIIEEFAYVIEDAIEDSI